VFTSVKPAAVGSIALTGGKYPKSSASPYEYQGIIIRATGFFDELLSLCQKLLVRPLVQPIEEFFGGIVLLEMDVLDVLSVWTVDRH